MRYLFFFILFQSSLLLALEGFDPKFEGVYDVTLQCSPQESSGLCAPLNTEWSMVVLEKDQNVYVSFVKTRYRLPSYVFDVNSLEAGGAYLSGDSTPTFFSPGSFDLSISSEDGNLIGAIHDIRYSHDISIRGKLRNSPTQFRVREPGTFSSDIIGGRFGGMVMGFKGYLAVKAQLDSVDPVRFKLAALWTDCSSGAISRFTEGFLDWNSLVGNLYSSQIGEHTYTKWSLQFSAKGDKTIQVVGLALSNQTGASYPISLTRLTPSQRPCP